ncbi:tyrosine-type recombinase/integrase [Fictibacillus enclensis]|uniref:tyrosine-type recombinase/integrase n=1 Tax=Fictibacillus enclensis TaxID=1017270 RepID=UPI0025A2267A|nr:tyrosine-type recombinase/integrase [Fictibacillus enclensis]MDM5338514.1 tyrosine-type recombinase/integrase [Fictibacillus enclensis]
MILESDYYKHWSENVKLKVSTKRQFSRTLQKFENFLIEQGMSAPLDFNKFYYDPSDSSYESIDSEIVDLFIEKLKLEGKSKRVLYDSIVALKNFFNFLEQYELINCNPLHAYTNPFYEYKLSHRALSITECKSLLKASYLLDPFNKQLYLLVLVLLTCGLRANELIQLKRKHINIDSKTITVIEGKKTSAETVHMTEAVSELFRYYFSSPIWLEWDEKGNDNVFFHNKKKLNYNFLTKVLNIIATKANLGKRISPHQLRHSMATLMFNAGIDITIISRQLRHKRLETTLLYVIPNIEMGEILDEYTNNHKQLFYR